MSTAIPSNLKAIISQYFDMLYNCDVSILDRIFSSNAYLQTVREGGHVVISKDEYRTILSKRAAPAISGVERDDRILQADLIGDSCACVKASARVGALQFLDYLCLLKVEGDWQIVSKVYMQVS